MSSNKREPERRICTKEGPMPKPKPPGTKWTHESAMEISDDGDVRTMECPACGITWKEELAQ